MPVPSSARTPGSRPATTVLLPVRTRPRATPPPAGPAPTRSAPPPTLPAQGGFLAGFDPRGRAQLHDAILTVSFPGCRRFLGHDRTLWSMEFRRNATLSTSWGQERRA